MIKFGFSDCARKVRKAYFEIPHVYIEISARGICS